MTQHAALPNDGARFSWLERDKDDFPCYRGRSVETSTVGWIIVLVGVAIGFAELLYGPRVLTGAGRYLAAFLCGAIPLAALAWSRGGTGRRCFVRCGAWISSP